MDEIISWEALENEPRENSSDWYWTVGIITVSLVVICILLNNTLFGILIALGAFTLSMHTLREPRIVTVGILNKGIRIDGTFYEYKNLHSFSVVEKEHVPKLIIQTKKTFMPNIILRMDGIDPHEVEDILKKKIKDGGHEEPLSHKILDYLGF